MHCRELYTKILPLVQAFNEKWIADYRKQNPNTQTTEYCKLHKVGVFGFFLCDNITRDIPHIDVWDSVPNKWHDETQTIKIVQRYTDCLEMIQNSPEIGVFRKENNIEAIRDGGNVYIYVSNLLPEHEALFNQYNAIIEWATQY